MSLEGFRWGVGNRRLSFSDRLFAALTRERECNPPGGSLDGGHMAIWRLLHRRVLLARGWFRFSVFRALFVQGLEMDMGMDMGSFGLLRIEINWRCFDRGSFLHGPPLLTGLRSVRSLAKGMTSVVDFCDSRLLASRTVGLTVRRLYV